MKLVVAITALAIGAAACGASSSPAAQDAPHRHRAPSVAKDDERPEDRYEVEFELPAQTRAGLESLAKVHVHPQGSWHMNTQYPVALELSTPEGVELASGKLTKQDAERLDEDALTFSVPFTANNEGQTTFEGELSFAMCGEKACDPMTIPVAFTVDVGACDDAVAC